MTETISEVIAKMVTGDLCLLRFCSFSPGFPPLHQVQFAARLWGCFIKIAFISLFIIHFFQSKGWTAVFWDFLFVDHIENMSQCFIKHHKRPVSAINTPPISSSHPVLLILPVYEASKCTANRLWMGERGVSTVLPCFSSPVAEKKSFLVFLYFVILSQNCK